MHPHEQSELFEKLFSKESLYELYIDKFHNSSAKGIDRLNGVQFASRAKEDLAIASKKCMDGSFRFSPYLEFLKSKGKGKNPRVISIPTIRDRVILKQVNNFLSYIIPDCVPKSIAANYVQSVSKDLQKIDPLKTYVCSCDIVGFYDNIKIERLIKLISKKVKQKNAINLIRHSLLTPTVFGKSKKSNRAKCKNNQTGVPQGLSISNILASIYMKDIDDHFVNEKISYYRYVDDVLIYGEKTHVESSYDSLRRRLKYRGLNTHPPHSPKTHLDYLITPFTYLGYHFEGKKISVREATIEAFLHSIASRFSDYIHNKNIRLKKHKNLSEDALKNIFIDELNDKITGAINENKRYGWVAYYLNINQLTLLYKIDLIIERMFTRLSDFENKPPITLKKITRAFHEMKFNPRGGYIRDYDVISTTQEILNFLKLRGRISDDEKLTELQIKERFERYKQKHLSNMQPDEGELYN